MEIPRRAFDGDADDGRTHVGVVALRCCELFAERADGHGQIVGGGRGRAQVLDGVASLGDRLRRLIDRALQLLSGFGGTIRHRVGRRLEA